MTARRSFMRCDRGAAGAEMALMLPWLVVLLFGAIEVGYYFYNQHQVVKGVRDGARYASRQSFVSIHCTDATTPSVIPGDVLEDIRNVTRTGQLAGGTARVPGWINAQVTVTSSCPATSFATGLYSEEPNAPVVTVAATVPYQSLFDGIGVVTDNYTLSASQQAAVMGI